MTVHSELKHTLSLIALCGPEIQWVSMIELNTDTQVRCVKVCML
jgi:hypothetical protein